MLDADSRRALRRFAVTLVLILAWAYLNRDQLPAGGVTGMMAVAATTTAAVALAFREPFRGPALNRWDETLAFMALGCLAALLPDA